MDRIYKEIQLEVKKAKNVLIISHRKPDGDTLGAAIALKIWLGDMGKDVDLACVDKPAESFSFLPFMDEYRQEFEIHDYDLIFIVDAGASYMTDFEKKYPNLFTAGVPIINIDHHASNDFFGKINLVDPVAASATVIIYRMFEFFGMDIDSDIATALLTGIYNDTGSFMHSNTDQEVYMIASKLMALGAKVADISSAMFNTKPVSTLRLWGRVLESAYKTNEDIVLSVIKEEDYEMTDSGPSELSGVIDYLNMVPSNMFTMLLTEDRKGQLKASMRTRRADLDLSKIAANFGGGGHPRASGFTMKGTVDDFRESMIDSLHHDS